MASLYWISLQPTSEAWNPFDKRLMISILKSHVSLTLMVRSLCKCQLMWHVHNCDLAKDKYDLLFLCAIPNVLWLDSQNVQIQQKYFSQFSCNSCQWLQNRLLTTSWHWQSKFGTRRSISTSIPFFLTFWSISKFPDPYQILLSFYCLFKIFTFSWLSWPVGTWWS